MYINKVNKKSCVIEHIYNDKKKSYINIFIKKYQKLAKILIFILLLLIKIIIIIISNSIYKILYRHILNLP